MAIFLGSYRIATRPRGRTPGRLTSLKSIRFDSPANKRRGGVAHSIVCFAVDDRSQLDITPSGPQLRGMGLALSGGRPFFGL